MPRVKLTGRKVETVLGVVADAGGPSRAAVPSPPAGGRARSASVIREITGVGGAGGAGGCRWGGPAGIAPKPLAVGGDRQARHGIILTADYMAKRRGVKTGMALWQAKQACPELNIVSPRMDLYLRFSRIAHEIYADYTDMQEPYGIDECWLDVTGSASI